MEASLIGLGPTALIHVGIAVDRVASFTSLTGAVVGAAPCSVGAALGDPQVFLPPMGLAAARFFPGYHITGKCKIGSDVRVAPILLGVSLTGAIVSRLIVAQWIETLGDRGFFWLIGGLACARALAALTRLRDMNR